MINHIIENLYLTFRSSGENVNSQIHNSEETLLKLSTNIEFYPSLFSIIQSNEIPIEIRKAALIYLQYLINNWSVLLTGQAQLFIIENFPLLLKNSLQFLKIDLKLTETLVECTFFAGNSWSNIFDIINSGFCNFENEKEGTFVSIILLNSISQHYRYDKCIPPVIDNFYPFLQNFITFSITQLFEENGQEYNYLPFIALCYRTIKHLNSLTLSPYFNENNENLNQLLIQTTKISNFERMNDNIDEFIFFSKQAIKFSSTMIQKYPDKINFNVTIQILQSFFEFFSKFRNFETILSSSAQLINAFLFYEPTFQFISGNICSNFIIKVIFPFFHLNSNDIENSKNDPSQFLAKFQTQDCVYKSESRAYLYQTLIQKASRICKSNEFPHFCFIIFQIFNKVLNNYLSNENHNESDDSLLFSIFFIFSSIYPSFPYLNNDLFAQLLNVLSQLITSSSHLVISAVLILLKCISISFKNSSSSFLFVPDFYVHTAQLLISHPSQLVRCYAATTFYEIIENANQTIESQQKKIVFDSCSQLLPDIFKSCIELSASLNDFDFIEILSKLMVIFSSSLVEVAPQLIIQIFELFLSNQNYLTSNSYGAAKDEGIIDSLFEFIEILLNENKNGNSTFSDDLILSPLLYCIYQVLSSNSLEFRSINVIFEFVAKLSLASSFDFQNDEGDKNDKTENLPLFQSLFTYQIKRRNATFLPIFWPIYEIIPQIIENKDLNLIENGFFAMRSIFISNPENSNKEEILNFTLQIGSKFLNQFIGQFSDELYATILFLATVFIATPPETIKNINEIYQCLIPALKNFFQYYESWVYSSILFISMLIQNPTTAFEIIKANFNPENEFDCVTQFCLEWADISDPLLQMLFILNFNNNFSPEINCIFIEKALSSFKENYGTFGFEDQEQKINIFISPNVQKVASPCSLILIDWNKILFYFGQFMQSISQSFPELIAKFNEEMQEIENYLNNDDYNNIDQN